MCGIEEINRQPPQAVKIKTGLYQFFIKRLICVLLKNEDNTFLAAEGGVPKKQYDLWQMRDRMEYQETRILVLLNKGIRCKTGTRWIRSTVL